MLNSGVRRNSSYIMIFGLMHLHNGDIRLSLGQTSFSSYSFCVLSLATLIQGCNGVYPFMAYRQVKSFAYNRFWYFCLQLYQLV